MSIISELLLPAGSVDSFRAAIRGGADAIYLGLKQFNARVRANNFGIDQLSAIMKEAKLHGVKIYVTLNTVIKNNEIELLLNFLANLDANKVDAIIIQDWGVFYLAKKYFPNLVIHASTQMANHNSIGVEYCYNLGFERCVLARELTMLELENIVSKSKCELEVFVHGALCYSFSGMCFFSSFIGGRGANRGLCSQVCRMTYSDNGKRVLPFNLRDNEQISNILHLQEIGINSLKIEGRMKSAEYVYRVAKAYRNLLDGGNLHDSEEMLELDFAREKTGYFLNGNISQAIASNSNTGIYLGRILGSSKDSFKFESTVQLQENDRIRIQKRKSQSTISLKLEKMSQKGNFVLASKNYKETLSNGDQVFLIGRKEESFPSRLMNVEPIEKKLNKRQINDIIIELTPKKSSIKQELFLRIDNLDWLEFIRPEELLMIIFSLNKRELRSLNFERKFIKNYIDKIAIELPKFIAEGVINEWQDIIDLAYENGIRTFVISHLSQKILIPNNCKIISNEQVYVFNDASAKFISECTDGIFCYPIENSWSNLSSMKNVNGIVIMNSKPELFYSRMPIKIKEHEFSDTFGRKYKTCVNDGATIVFSQERMSILQYQNKLFKAGFYRFLFDFKHETPDPKLIKDIFINFKKSNNLQNTNSFNFGRDLE